MGQTTPNISIYVPAAGETNYDQSFLAGMINVDQHDHSGAPNKGVRIATSGIADASITYEKLNSNVADTATGIGTEGGGFANRLTMLGLLKNIYQIPTTNGFISKDGSAAHARTLQGVANQVVITNPAGVAGDPTISIYSTALTWTPTVLGGATPQDGTYGVQHGRYFQLGPFVIAIGQLTWTGNSVTGDLVIGGFPTSFGSGGTSYISTCGFENITLPGSTLQVALDGNNNDTTANVVGYRSAGSAQNVQLGAAGKLNFTLIYF